MVVMACNSLRTLRRLSTGEPDAENPHVRFYEGGGGRFTRLLLYSTVDQLFRKAACIGAGTGLGSGARPVTEKPKIGHKEPKGHKGERRLSIERKKKPN